MPCFGSGNKQLVCRVVLLDETEIALDMKTSTKGQELLDQIFNRINLLERDYFGLRFMDHCDEARWLDLEKHVLKQNRNLSVFYFGVRFYSSDPCKLQEELTRYLFFQQLKKDILQSRLHCSFTVATRLFAYVVQAELGDFDSIRHTLRYVSEFRFLPNQSEEMEAQTEEIHKTLKSMVPSDCELEFLDKAKWLDLYGADMHHVRGDDGVHYEFGIKPSGLLVKKRGNIIGNYVWPKISKLYFNGKKFHLSVWGKNEKEDSYTFVLPRKSSCKHLWKNCVEHHAFFRLERNNSDRPQVQKILHFGSKHRYSGRTQHEALSESMRRKRHPPEVQRKPSKKYPRRSFQEKRKATAGNRKMNNGVNHSQHNGPHNRWSTHEGNSMPLNQGGLYTTRDRTSHHGSHLAKFPKPSRRPGGMSGSDSECSRRRKVNKNYMSDDEAEIRRRRHRRRRHQRGYASAGDASGTETEGPSCMERKKQGRGQCSGAEDTTYDSTAQWVDSTQNIYQVNRSGKSYEDVRTPQQQRIYKSEPDILLTPALVPVQKSSVSIARVREDQNPLHNHNSGSHYTHDSSLYKVRSESTNNKLNFKVLLELGPESTHDVTPNRIINGVHRRTPVGSPQKRANLPSPARRSPQRSPLNNYQFVGMKSTEL